jgi:hypothetical protein
VKVGGAFSPKVRVLSGVPQGSVLGPVLFVAYINEIANTLLSQDSTLILFADDMSLIHPIVDNDSVSRIQQDINKISSHISDIGQSLNIGKCKFQVLRVKKSSDLSSVSLLLEGVPLEQVNTYKYLGVEIDCGLTFSSHSHKVSAKSKQAIGGLNRVLRKWAPRYVFTKAVQSIALLIFLYAIESWFPPAIKDQKKLERVVKFAACLSLNNFSRETQYEDLLRDLKWKPVARIVAERRLITMKKYMDGVRWIPDSVFPLETAPTNRRSQRLIEQRNRSTLRLELFKNQKNKLENQLSAAQMRILWNSLDESIIYLNLKMFRNEISSDNFFLRRLRNDKLVSLSL